MKLLLIMLMLASSVFAQEYIKVDENEVGVFYVDKTTVRKEKEIFKFSGKVETKTYTSVTDFATDCKAYVVLFEQFETPDLVMTRRQRKPQVVVIEKGNPIESAVNYVCHGTLKKGITGVTVPQAD